MEKILSKLRELILNAKRPALMNSFGKDSMVLVWMISEKIGFKNFPSLFNPDCFEKKNKSFIDNTVSKYQLNHIVWNTVINDAVISGDNNLLIQYAPIKKGYVIFPQHLKQSYKQEDPCLIDVLNNVSCERIYNDFDLIISGLKKSDLGKGFFSEKGYKENFIENKKDESTSIYPLWELEDNEIWKIIYDNDIPFDGLEYENKEKLDKQHNVDICFSCVDNRNAGPVWCKVEQKYIKKASYSKEDMNKKVKYYKKVLS